jgi:hypothetical protein
MLRHIATGCIFASAILVPQARAACAAGTNPLEALAGTWTFSKQGFNFPPTEFIAAAGRFTARVVPVSGPISPIGILQVAETASRDGSAVHLSVDGLPGNSRYQVYDDCSGGTLTFNTPGRPQQAEFYFATPDEIVFVGSQNADIVSGSAKRVSAGLVAPACPPNALTGLQGTWVFSVDGFHFPPTLFLASAGRFTATIGTTLPGTNPPSPAVPIGFLDINQAVALDGSPTRLESAVHGGHYALNENCSGGSLTFNTGSRPVQYDFWFNSPTSMVFVGSNQGDIVVGSARQLP